MPGIRSQSPGNASVTPKNITMTADRYDHTSGGIVINAVETFNTKVKTMTDAAKEPTTMYGVHQLRPLKDEPMTTGRSGSIHGAKTVRTPAINEITRNVIYLMFARKEARVGEPDHLVI